MDTEDIVGLVSVVLVLCCAFFVIGMVVCSESIDVKLTQETADDVCQQLTRNLTAVASDDSGNRGGKLICIIPSFDSTQNIIVKTNNE